MKLYHLNYYKFSNFITFDSPLIQFIPNLQICTGTNGFYENQYVIIFSFLTLEIEICYDKTFNFKLHMYTEII